MGEPAQSRLDDRGRGGRLLPLDRSLRVGESPLEVRLALVAIAFVLSVLTYRYVEQPFRKARSKPVRAVAVGVACAAALSCTAFVMADTRPQTKVAQAEQEVLFLANEVPPNVCHQSAADAPRACPGEVFVWGDSMAWAWSPLGIGNSRERCPPLVGWQPGPLGYQQRCKAFNDAALVEAQRAERVVLVAAWLSYPPEVIREWLPATLSRVGHATIIGPTPVLRDKMPQCLRYGIGKCAVPRAEFDAEAAPVRKLLREIATQHGARYVDLADHFCNAKWCPALRNGKPLYWDERHVSLSASGDAEVLDPAVQPEVVEAGGRAAAN